MRRAEAILLADAPLAPIYFPASRNLVSPGLSGWVDNLGDAHQAQWLCKPPAPPVAGVGAATS
jgi:oligopeptide transport system substrate-binding protein